MQAINEEEEWVGEVGSEEKEELGGGGKGVYGAAITPTPCVQSAGSPRTRTVLVCTSSCGSRSASLSTAVEVLMFIGIFSTQKKGFFTSPQKLVPREAREVMRRGETALCVDTRCLDAKDECACLCVLVSCCCFAVENGRARHAYQPTNLYFAYTLLPTRYEYCRMSENIKQQAIIERDARHLKSGAQELSTIIRQQTIIIFGSCSIELRS